MQRRHRARVSSSGSSVRRGEGGARSARSTWRRGAPSRTRISARGGSRRRRSPRRRRRIVRAAARARTTTRRRRLVLLFFSTSQRARGSCRASCVCRRAHASSGMLHADAVESSARGAVRGSRGHGVPAMDARGEARVVRAAAGERERRRARMGWTSRAMRREGVVVGRGGSGVEVNNGGGVGAN